MVGVAAPLARWSLVWDCLEPLDAPTAKALLAAEPGAVCFGRYLHNLTPGEVAAIHSVGASILPIIYAPDAPLNDALGNTLGQTMASKAMGLGMPMGVSVVVDLEAEQGTAPDVLAYAEEIAAILKRYAWRPGSYAGAPQLLSSGQLYSLPVEPYWRGGSVGIPEPACGWGLIQSPQLDQEVAGHRVDISWHCVDAHGRGFTVWAPAPPSERETVPELPDSPGP